MSSSWTELWSTFQTDTHSLPVDPHFSTCFAIRTDTHSPLIRISNWYAFPTDPHFELIRIPHWSAFRTDTQCLLDHYDQQCLLGSALFLKKWLGKWSAMFVRSAMWMEKGWSVRYGRWQDLAGKHDDPYCYAREFIWNVENVGNTKTNWAEPEVQTKPQINAFFKFSPREMELRCALEHSPILKSSFLID